MDLLRNQTSWMYDIMIIFEQKVLISDFDKPFNLSDLRGDDLICNYHTCMQYHVEPCGHDGSKVIWVNAANGGFLVEGWRPQAMQLSIIFIRDDEAYHTHNELINMNTILWFQT